MLAGNIPRTFNKIKCFFCNRYKKCEYIFTTSGMIMRTFFRILILAGIIATTWNCSESSAVQDSALRQSSNDSNIQIPQNIVVSEPSYLYQIGTSYYVIVPTNMTVNDGFGKVIGTFNTSTGAIMSLAGEIIAINLDLSKLPVVTPKI